MNILFDRQIFYAQRFGGISRYYCELASGLCKLKNFNISVCAPLHTNEYLQHCKFPYGAASYFNYQFRGASRVRNIGRKMLLPIHRLLRPHPDIIHETYYSILPVEQGRIRVLTVYDMIHELYFDEFKHDLGTSIAKLAAVKRADHVICISESTRRDLLNLVNVDPKKISTIYLGQNLISKAISTDFSGPGIRRPYLLFVGKRGGYKNFLRFCKSVASSAYLKTNFDIIAFGGGPLEMSELISLEKMGLRNQVINISGDDDLLIEYYRNASLFVYPSLYEGFGIPPLESMNFDCPVACSNTSSIPEIVGDAGIYFDPSSIDSMRDALERGINDESLRKDLIRKGRERRMQFSWERCVDETAKIYRSLAGC